MATKTLKELGLKKGQKVSWTLDRGMKRKGAVVAVVPAGRNAKKLFAKKAITKGTNAVSKMDRIAVDMGGTLALPKWFTKFKA